MMTTDVAGNPCWMRPGGWTQVGILKTRGCMGSVVKPHKWLLLKRPWEFVKELFRTYLVLLQGLNWSETLAETAQAWAANLKSKGCVLEHRKDSDYGENIYWAGSVTWSDGRTEVQSMTPQKVVDNWGSEKQNYNHSKN